MKIQFGTDGWRGIIDDEITIQTVAKVAQALSGYLTNKNEIHKELKVAVGWDGRKHSQTFAMQFAKVLSGNGIQAYLSDKINSTPVLSYFVRSMNLDAGVMITASHNPPHYNGVKFKDSYGGPFFTEKTASVEEFLGRDIIQSSEDLIQQVDFSNVYYEDLNTKIDFELIKKSGISAVIDSMGGAGQQIIEYKLRQHNINCKTIYKFALPDFNGRIAEPIEKNLVPLRNTLLSTPGFSLGIATDGDADRLGVLMENGEWLSAQYTILLLADYIVNVKKMSGNIVKTSSVTDKLTQYFSSNTRKVYDVQVGFKYICERMVEEPIAFGAEESGGFGYGHHIPERDGIFSAFLFLEMLASSGYTKLSDYVAVKKKEFGIIYYDRIDVGYMLPDRMEKLPWLLEHYPAKLGGFKIKDIQTFNSSRNIINGLKFYLEGDCRWLLLRASETEPMFRIYAEGNSSEELEDLLEHGFTLIQEAQQ